MAENTNNLCEKLHFLTISLYIKCQRLAVFTRLLLFSDAISSSYLKSFVIIIFVLLLFMASSSSLSRGWLYHVFLSFRGEDVRKGFLSHVRKELKRKGIIVFVDEKIERGESVGPVLVAAIRESRVAVVLLSRNYANSSWCLDELVEIMKCRKEHQQTVLTIFYEVDPSDVRKQTGDFGKAFDESCVGKTEEVKQAWRQALNNVAGIAGYHSSNCDNEADLIDKVASNVTAVLGFTSSKDFDDIIGMGGRIVEIKSKLSLQPEDASKVIVLVGPPGIGKTTTARALYSQLSPGFPFSTFLENIRGSYDKPFGDNYRLKLHLHQNLLSQLLHQRDIEVRHLGMAQEMLSDKKVLVVLDEVDSWWQLEATAKQRGWVGPGSIIIITTEDRKLLQTLGLGNNHIYEMKFPTTIESLEIFCQYAFGEKSPDKGFERLAWEVTGLAGDLPLGLSVMGSYLRGMSMDYWINALPRLRSSLESEIESTLRFSYDVLSDKDKNLFLHIACFFSRCKVDTVKRCLEKSGLEVNHGLQVLADKSLISIEEGCIKMHSLLATMGREIVKKESPEEAGNRKFLMDPKDISDVLEDNTGTGKVLGIALFTNEKIQISKSAFEGMNNLQFLDVSSWGLCIPDGLNSLPDKLRFLHWNGCPLRLWPSKFSGKLLVELIMQHSSFEKLWDGIKPLQCLKLLNLSFSKYLKEIPDLSKATSLEELHLSDCKSLLELTSSIGNATKLTVCKLNGCSLLKELPSSIRWLVNLEELDISDCQNLKKFSGCSSLIKLDMSFTEIEEMPSSISTWSRLYQLNLAGCSNITDFPNVPDSIVELNLCGTGIEEVPRWIGKLFCLRKLMMYQCKMLKTISPNISKLENLEFLALSSCDFGENDALFEAKIEWGFDAKCRWSFRSDLNVHYILPICIPDKARTSPISLRLRSSCHKTISDCIGHLSGLTKLDITECSKLVSLPQLPGSLVSINGEGCESLKRIGSSFQNPNVCLNFANCFNLNQKARKLLQTSACKYVILPGEEVPAHFTHRASSGFLTINLTPRPLPSPFRFKACILLSDNTNLEDHNDDDLSVSCRSILLGVSCRLSCKHNGLSVRYRSIQLHHMPDLYGDEEHLYIFEDSFSQNQDYPEAEETTLSELTFVFRVHDKTWKIKGCGVRLLEEVPQCILDRNEDDDDDNDGDDDETDDDDGEDCLNLNQKAKKLIPTFNCEYTLVPGKEVPADFTHQATSDSLTINVTPRSLPSLIRFKACILLSRDYYEDNEEGAPRRSRDLFDLRDEEEDNSLFIHLHYKGVQNGLTVSMGSNHHDMPYLHGLEDRLYKYEDYFWLDHDFPGSEDTTISNLVFQFEVSYEKWNVKGCGVQLLREEESADDDDGGADNDDFEYDTEDEDDEFGDGDNDDFEDDIEDEENEDDEVGDDDNEEDNVDNIQKGEEAGREEDAETRSRKRMRFSLW
ncbi:disease resistance-like protein DSC2 [Raphanus sativus]|uniref:ADP-ribosyl cyclase/cyclic ADP-ribose hydrolase n=1 Tax=Raphanus sativus TaxID=3726 RepID=A0A9W3DC37_RAPSA|nr:disease resistance-like protein DSC2 [Raphanus sativus]